jgi:hypothetical protein
LYGDKSFTSTDPNNYEIFIEEVWEKGENNGFKKVKIQTEGLLISRSEISYIEFFSLGQADSPDKENPDESGQKTNRKSRRKRI